MLTERKTAMQSWKELEAIAQPILTSACSPHVSDEQKDAITRALAVTFNLAMWIDGWAAIADGLRGVLHEAEVVRANVKP
jgi:hypothetical protein